MIEASVLLALTSAEARDLLEELREISGQFELEEMVLGSIEKLLLDLLKPVVR